MTTPDNKAVNETAKEAGLLYVSDSKPGFQRKPAGKSFQYLNAEGKRLTGTDDLRRIGSLVIPPAWKDVWICPNPRGHLQATGRDERNRKQYLYHPRWREVRDSLKYDRTIAFGQSIGSLRGKVQRDLRRPGLVRDKVLAAIVRLMESTFIRVGNEEYARTNKSFGLTTFRDRHATVVGSHIHFEFKGKSGVKHAIDLNDRRLAKIVKGCQELPGQELFQYVDEGGERRDVKSEDVNVYLREATGEEFTAKDIRTWSGTVLAACALEAFEPAASKTEAKKNIVHAVGLVSKLLGNTRSVCRKCYIHPAVLETYEAGRLKESLRLNRAGTKLRNHLSPEEAAVLRFLKRAAKA